MLKYERGTRGICHFWAITLKQNLMKKNVLIFGSIAGLLLTAMMIFSTVMCYTNPEFEGNETVGYLSMILIFSLIFVGIKNYRDKYNNGVISFGKAFKTGFLIALVASTMYTVVWLVDYYVFIPDFLDKYIANMLRQAQQKGATAAEMASKTAEMNKFREMYKNPLLVIVITYLEVLPLGALIALISAWILRRKQPRPAVA